MVIPPCFDYKCPGFCLSALSLAGIPPFLPPAALPQVFVPILPSGGLLDFHGVPQFFILGLELFRRRLPGAVRIQARPIWGLIHQQAPYEGALIYRIEKAVDYHNRVVNLPCSSNLTQQDVLRVVDALN